jgi:hypothetical protein
MATSRPSFPQHPTSAPAAIPMPSVADSYIPVGSAQGSGRPPQTPNPMSTSYPLPYQHPSAYLPASQHIPVSVHPHLAFPVPQGPVTYAPPSRVQRSVTMPIPDLPHRTQVAPGPYQSYALQAPIMSLSQSDSGMLGASQIPTDRQPYHDDSDYEEDRDDSGTDSSDTLAKGPQPPLAGIQKTRSRRNQPPNRAHTLANPSPPAAGISDPPHGPLSGLRARIRNLVNHGSHPPNQPTTPVRLPQQATFRCRLPECQDSITGDIAARLSGFCCNSHMWSAIEHDIATLCSVCNGRACPEGKAYCSAECANGRQ